MVSPEKAASQPDGEQKPAAPSISLPKGGGAIRGMGEKFAANPVTGTGSMSVPIATSPGRSGFGPQLSLSYDSGAGNGLFGFGWGHSLPSVTRKTDKGLPQYLDGRDSTQDSDVFILSGAEDLVPVYRQDAAGAWVRDAQGDPLIHEDPIDGYRVRRYRPRIEGLFARIERWTLIADPRDVHWRSLSRDNILTLYGCDPDSRIVDPQDAGRVFTWLICETRDDKGNGVLYRYKAEDGLGVDSGRASESNRGASDDACRTASRYLKRIYYGNRTPLLDNAGNRPRFLDKAQIDTQIANADWMLEVVFDYGEHDVNAPKPGDTGEWPYRSDPFSTYRAGFEVRTTRRCQRVLMFHHFPDEAGVGRDCLVRSTDFTYSDEQDPADARNPVYTFLRTVAQTGYRRNNGGYDRRSLPPVEFEYTHPIVQDAVHDVDAASLESLPIGVDGSAYQWTDLHGEGIPGILTEQAGAWFYKRNLSPISARPVEFAPLECVATKPNLALAGGGAQFMDLAGDGQLDLVVLDGPMPGLYEHDEAEGWQPFRPFTSRLNRDMRDPNLKFVDLDGDGHADLLITEDDVFVWHASLAEDGFGPARRVAQALDEENGPHIVFADGTQSIYLADLSGDGLTDLVRIRNGEVCYWPNLGYGRFGAKVTMDHAPHFDNPDQFDHKRIRLADIDGSGTTDIIYLHREGVRLYFNQSGNGWSAAQTLAVFPCIDDFVSLVPTDLLGNGTACLVWSSPLPGDARRQMRYVDLMGGQKPHLLVKTVNNLGAETRVHYAPSTRFYLQDKRDGKPWITRLPFPVHVVERVETYDHISRNRFVTRHAYHHGYFDGEEREFRGFGMVEQWDTEQLAALIDSDTFPVGDNVANDSHVPPVHTKTWFHTGVYLGREHISDFYAGLLNATDQGEYFREPGLTDAEARALLLPDTVLPPGLTLADEREACRSLKGAMLRQEVYALDGSDIEPLPYTVTEQNFTIRALQPQAGNRHGVFFTHAREAINFHYERNIADPRIAHALTLEVDDVGNVLKSAAVAYGRRLPDMSLSVQDRDKQAAIFITYTENRVTNAIEAADDYRTPLPCETSSYELTGLTLPADSRRFTLAEMFTAGTGAMPIVYEQSPTSGVLQKRLIEHVRTRYRPDDFGMTQGDPLALLALGTAEPLAIPGESYKLAFTSGLLAGVYGGRVTYAMLEAEGRYVHSEGDADWWIPSGRMFCSPGSSDTSAQELARARQHFFLPRRYRDPFGHDAFVDFDGADLLMVETRDAVGNRSTVEANDYRVLQPRLVSDPNRNQSAVAFDTLGMVVASAVMGKPLPAPVEGDSLSGLVADLTQAEIDAFHDAVDPHVNAPALLQNATTSIIYDVDRFRRSQQANPADPDKWLPACAATLARETHANDPLPPQDLKIQISFSYSDGFGREIQKKIQAEPGRVPIRDAAGKIIVGPDGQQVMTSNDVSPRWVGSGWTVFNNKGKPVRQYEPFFTDTQHFEFDVRIGVSPVLFYDSAERVVATLHPNHTWEKVMFDPWLQESWDVSDTALVADPGNDPDVGDFLRRLPDADYLPTWYAQRQSGALGPHKQGAAQKAAVHAATPAVAHADALGRTFLTVAHNRFKYGDTPPADPPVEEFHRTRVVFDIEGNQREVIDAKGRVVMRYDYDMLGKRIHQASMEAGARWMLGDVSGKPIDTWDSRDHQFRTAYDQLRRPVDTFLVEGSGPARLIGRTVYGESRPDPEAHNLRGKPVQLFDQAGVVTSEDYDFKGNLLSSRRQLASEFKTTLDWSVPADVLLEHEVYTGSSRFNALNRPVELTTPHTPAMQPSVIRPNYNEANLLERVEVNLRGAQQNDQPVWTPFVTDIDYDAKGQRTLIDYGNGVRTTYEHDPLTFRLIHLLTRRNATDFSDDCPQSPPAGWPGCQVQNLHYTYDPAGNITHIQDDAQQTDYFRKRRVEPSNDYIYDAIYRLIEAAGREHLGQAGGAPIPHSYNDVPRVGIDWSANDGNAMGTYTEQFVYDEAGNFKEMVHRGSDPANPGWTRTYTCSEASLLETGKQSNRLTDTTIGATTETYSLNGHGYDAHGNMLQMPQLRIMEWDFRDQLHMSQRQAVNAADEEGVQRKGERTYYVYDAGGQRVRKVTERPNGARKNERIYLDGFELYREYDGSGLSVSLELETLHVMDDKQRIALVETRTQGDDDSPEPLISYQLGNHLGSASLELDVAGRIISYEEYTPYGSTSYQAVNKDIKAAAKRYRYTGMERDEESGLYYHGARYYSPWLGTWANCDPIGISGGINLYQYSRSNPERFVDLGGTEPAEPERKPKKPLPKKDTPPLKPDVATPTKPEGPKEPTTKETPPPAKPNVATPTKPATQAGTTTIAPKWEGDNILLPKVAFESLQKSLGSDGTHIRFQPIKGTTTTAKRGAKKETIGLGKGYGTLQIDVNSQSTSFLFGLLKDVVQSKERAVIGFPAGGVKIETHTSENQGVKSQLVDDILRNAGQTFLSKDLQKKVYGALLPPGQILTITAPYEDLTLLYLMSSMATNTTVVHELLGHFYLATKGVPIGHPESLKGKGILDVSGQPFDKTVIDFIQTQVEAEAKKNLKSP